MFQVEMIKNVLFNCLQFKNHFSKELRKIEKDIKSVIHYLKYN